MDREEAAALANLVASLLRKVFRSNLLSDGLFLITCGFVFFLIKSIASSFEGDILSLRLGGDVHLVGQLVLVLLVAADGLELGVVVAVDRFCRSCHGYGTS